MENYIEKFKKTNDIEEIKEIFRKIKEEDLPIDQVIPPRVVAAKLIGMNSINSIFDLLHACYEEEYDLPWEEYIPYDFFLEKIRNSDDIEEIGLLLSELSVIDYSLSWVRLEFSLEEIIDKAKKSQHPYEAIRFYLGFLRAGHEELKTYMHKFITRDRIEFFINHAENMCELTFLFYFMNHIERDVPFFYFSQDKIKEFLRNSPVRCIAEFLHISAEMENKPWQDLILPYLGEINIEDEDLDDILIFFEDLLNVYGLYIGKPKEIKEVFAPIILDRLRDEKNIPFTQLIRGISLLSEVYYGVEFIDKLSIWTRFDKKWPSYEVAYLIMSLIDMGYPLDKIPINTLLHYLNYHDMFGNFLYYTDELLPELDRYEKRYISFLKTLVYLYGEERVLKDLSLLPPDKFLPILSYIRNTIDALTDLTQHPNFLAKILDSFSQISELEELLSILNKEEKDLFMHILSKEKMKKLMLRTNDLGDVNEFLRFILNNKHEDKFYTYLFEIFDTFTKEDMEMILSSENNVKEIGKFLYLFEKLQNLRGENLQKRFPSKLIREKLYLTPNLEVLGNTLIILSSLGVLSYIIDKEFLKELFLREKTVLQMDWKKRPYMKRLLSGKKRELLKNYKPLHASFIEFYKKLGLLRPKYTDWVKEFSEKEIEKIIEKRRAGFVLAFLELLYYDGYPSYKLQKIDPNVFITSLIEKDVYILLHPLFEKRTLLDVLIRLGYPMEWMLNLEIDKLVDIIISADDLEDLDLFLLKLRDIGLSRKRIEGIFYNEKMKNYIKQQYGNARTLSALSIIQALLTAEIPIPPYLKKYVLDKELLKEIYSRDIEKVFLKNFSILNPAVPSFLDGDNFLEALIRDKGEYMATYYYRDFVKLACYLGRPEYEIEVRKRYLSAYSIPWNLYKME